MYILASIPPKSKLKDFVLKLDFKERCRRAASPLRRGYPHRNLLEKFYINCCIDFFTNFYMLNFPDIDSQTKSHDPLINHLILSLTRPNLFTSSPFLWRLFGFDKRNQYDEMAFSQIHLIGACNEKESKFFCRRGLCESLHKEPSVNVTVTYWIE